MSQPIVALIAILAILEVKHFIFDYPLQTAYHVNNKGKYGHPGGIIHSGLHILGTSAAFLVVTPSLALGTAILAGEFLLHYHIDWAKDRVVRRNQLKAADRGFWWAIGADQLLHHLTYLAIATILVLS
ncbi:MAG: DUF3307 domain-containing protein [Bauldia sp.]